MIYFQKIYGFHALNHQIIEKSWDVMPVTEIHTENWAVFCISRIRKDWVSYSLVLGLSTEGPDVWELWGFLFILQIIMVTKMSVRIIILLFPQGKSSEDDSDSLLTDNLTFDPRSRLHYHYKHLIKITKLSQLHFAFYYQSKRFNLTKEDMLIFCSYLAVWKWVGVQLLPLSVADQKIISNPLIHGWITWLY